MYEVSEGIQDFVLARHDRIEQAIGHEFKVFALGCGSFGCAYEIPDTPWVLKVTGDEQEGVMWQKLWSLQTSDEGKKIDLDGLPYIERVFRLKTDYPTVAPWKIYGVIREKAESKQAVARALGFDYEELRHRLGTFKQTAYAYYDAKDFEHEARTRELQEQLSNLGAEIAEISPLTARLGGTLMNLTEMGIPPIDVHLGNMGLRREAFEAPDGTIRPASVIFIDPGVTKGGEEPALALVANPWPRAVCACGTIPEEPVEELMIDPSGPCGLVIAAPDEFFHEECFETYEEALQAAEAIAEDPSVVSVRVVQGPMFENPTEHWPFKRRSKIGPGPLKQTLGRVDDWDCKCGQYKCVCRGISADTRGREKTIITDRERKKRYNKLYKQWVKRT